MLGIADCAADSNPVVKLLFSAICPSNRACSSTIEGNEIVRRGFPKVASTFQNKMSKVRVYKIVRSPIY
jgi:hypothetical protein